jgi:hypothetical protein
MYMGSSLVFAALPHECGAAQRYERDTEQYEPQTGGEIVHIHVDLSFEP